MTDNDGPAISVERFLLTSDGEYTREGLAIRGRDFHAIDTISPFPLKLTWEALDKGLQARAEAPQAGLDLSSGPLETEPVPHTRLA